MDGKPLKKERVPSQFSRTSGAQKRKRRQEKEQNISTLPKISKFIGMAKHSSVPLTAIGEGACPDLDDTPVPVSIQSSTSLIDSLQGQPSSYPDPGDDARSDPDDAPAPVCIQPSPSFTDNPQDQPSSCPDPGDHAHSDPDDAPAPVCVQPSPNSDNPQSQPSSCPDPDDEVRSSPDDAPAPVCTQSSPSFTDNTQDQPSSCPDPGDDAHSDPDDAPTSICVQPSPSLTANLQDQSKSYDEKSAKAVDPDDIGRYVNERADPKTAARLLRWRWTPPPQYTFPVNKDGGKSRRFQAEYLRDYPWLAYSHLDEGCFCVPCVLFARQEGGRGRHEKLGAFVKKPFNRYKNARSDMEDHQKRGYHLEAVTKAEIILDERQQSIDSALLEQDVESRTVLNAALTSIVKTVLLCGRTGLPLRGHRDSGRVNLHKDYDDGEGVFKALMKFRVDAGDKTLLKFLGDAPGNALYTSWQTQNEVVRICGRQIVGRIVASVKRTGMFSVIADETTDNSTQEQLALCVRYVDHTEDSYTVREDFIGMVVAKETTGERLAELIQTQLEAVGLGLNSLRGQGYDGGANMRGRLRGVQAEIRRVQPLAAYTHCAAHRLNLAVMRACEVPQVRSLLGIVSSVNTFFKASAARTDILEKHVKNKYPEARSRRLKPLCATRWVERHDSLVVFHDLFPAIVSALQEVNSTASSAESAGTASCYLLGLLKFEFVATLVSCVSVFGLILPLSRGLQKSTLSLAEGYSMVRTVTDELKAKREDFHSVFGAAATLAESLDVGISVPRTARTQTQRANAPASTPEEYYRINMYLPLIDSISAQLLERFPSDHPGKDLQAVVPSEVHSMDDGRVVEAAKKYEQDLPSPTCLGSELLSWKLRWAKEDEKPSSALQALNHCHAENYPNIRVLLILLCTFPLTSCAAERTFSALKGVKSDYRSTMGRIGSRGSCWCMCTRGSQWIRLLSSPSSGNWVTEGVLVEAGAGRSCSALQLRQL